LQLIRGDLVSTAPDCANAIAGPSAERPSGATASDDRAGIAWSLTDHLTLHLRYERTGYAPIMSPDHDDGVLTSLQFTF